MYMGYLTDNGEKSARRLVAFWAMALLTITLASYLFGIPVDVQIFMVIGSIATVSIGASAIKNKFKAEGNQPPFDR